jgi:ribulose-5-phosphate 4-epimerase/fuculose-1-phosphate aldolase
MPTTSISRPAMVIADNFERPQPPRAVSIEEERRLRQRELVATFRLFGRFGFGEGVAGHVTARDPEHPNCYWVNPFGMSFSQIRVSDLLLVNEYGHVMQGQGPVNYAGFAIHSAVHRARPDVVAAVHAHSLHGKAFASICLPHAPITQDAAAFHCDHGVYAEYSGPAAGYNDEGQRIATALGDTKAAILRNHGLLTVGHSVGEAAWRFITLERSCRAELLARAAGTPISMPPSSAEAVYAELGTHYAGWFSFRPLWDQITAQEPDLIN